MVRLKHANDEKSTTGGREFHTFITLSLSAKKFLGAVFVVCGLYIYSLLYAWPLVFESVPNEKKIIKTDINHTKKLFYNIISGPDVIASTPNCIVQVWLIDRRMIGISGHKVAFWNVFVLFQLNRSISCFRLGDQITELCSTMGRTYTLKALTSTLISPEVKQRRIILARWCALR